MTDKVQRIRKEVERLKRWNNNVRESTRHMTLQEEDFNRGKHSSYLEILNFIDSLQEEPSIPEIVDEHYWEMLGEEPVSIWHDAKEPPEMYRKYFARYSDGRINGSWERHDDGFIPWKDVIKEHNITHWCYVEDLLKL